MVALPAGCTRPSANCSRRLIARPGHDVFPDRAGRCAAPNERPPATFRDSQTGGRIPPGSQRSPAFRWTTAIYDIE